MRPSTLTTACGRRVAAAMRVMLMELVLLARMAPGCTVCAAGTQRQHNSEPLANYSDPAGMRQAIQSALIKK